MVKTIISLVRFLWNTTCEVVFPHSCVGCSKQHTSLCLTCLSTVPRPAQNLPDWIHALYSYKHPLVRTSVWRIKYKYTYDLGKVYGKLLHETILADLSEERIFEKHLIYLIPIPLSKKRMRERGYNQAALLVQTILDRDTNGFYNDGAMILMRNEMQTRQSHTKNKQERLRNIVGSFVLGILPDKRAHYILIDDVVTTGATLFEARKVLEEAGVIKISAYTIAH